MSSETRDRDAAVVESVSRRQVCNCYSNVACSICREVYCRLLVGKVTLA
jgi:hypothetical protein